MSVGLVWTISEDSEFIRHTPAGSQAFQEFLYWGGGYRGSPNDPLPLCLLLPSLRLDPDRRRVLQPGDPLCGDTRSWFAGHFQNLEKD